MGIFPGSLTASRALISQRIGSLDTHGRLWAFKQSTPHPTLPSSLPNGTQLPITASPILSSLFLFLHQARFVSASITCWRRKKGLVRLLKAGLVISLNVYTAVATSEGCGVDEAKVSNQRCYLLPTWGGNWRAAFKLIEHISGEQLLFYLFIPVGLSMERQSCYSCLLTRIYTATQAYEHTDLFYYTCEDLYYNCITSFTSVKA